jgi:hypothetical protein
MKNLKILSKKDVKKFIEKPREVLYAIDDSGKVFALHFYDKKSGTNYKLQGTKDWPTIIINGIQMHPFESPREQTLSKIKLLEPIKGDFFDICTGLGYTAIEASKKAKKVITIEKDPNVLRMCRINPYSRKLFERKNINIRNADASKEIKKFPDRSFGNIACDPPRFPNGAELYSNNFFKELYRVLKYGGKLYFYTGYPSRAKNKRRRVFVENVGKRLISVGFKKVEWNEKTTGYVCEK